MSGSHVPYFRFYPSDFMNGVRGMTPQEVGVYTMILCRMYEESGSIEANILRLSTYCGMREATFKKTFDKLVDLGKLTVSEGMVSNPRAMDEISNRANDLKLKSKAGKASAKKRSENNDGDATGVQQAFNHTDTDTDTYDDDDSAGADLTFRERVLVAAGHDGCGLTASGKIVGNQADFAAFSKAMTDLRIDEETALALVTEVARRKSDGLASSLKYFIPSLQKFAGARDAPPVMAVVNGSARHPPRVEFDLTAFLADNPELDK